MYENNKAGLGAEVERDFDRGYPEETAAREVEVSREMSILGYQTEQLGKSFAELRTRLTPVVAERPTVGASTTPKESETLSPLAAEIRGNRLGIEMVNNQIQTLFHTLEI